MGGGTCVGRTLFWFEGGGPFPPGPPGLVAIVLGKWAVSKVPKHPQGLVALERGGSKESQGPQRGLHRPPFYKGERF